MNLFNKINYLSLIIVTSIILNYTFGQVKFPEVFPKELINKKICGNTSVFAVDYRGKTDNTMYAKFDYTITISETEGIYVEYNPGQRWNDASRNGKTESIKQFVLWKKEDKNSTDRYGDVTSSWSEYHYKIYPNYSSHYINSFSITKDEKGSSINLVLHVPNHQDASIWFRSGSEFNGLSYACPDCKSKICETIKSPAEIKKEKEELLKIESKKKEQDKYTTLKIDSFLTQNLLEDAALSYDQLNFSNLDLKNKIQSLLEKKHEKDTINLDEKTVFNYINYQIKTKNTNFLNLSRGEYEIYFNASGRSLNEVFPDIGVIFSNVNIPFIQVGSFIITQNSKALLKVSQQDSILISSNYSSGCTKTIYMDKNENFYLKTKTGLSKAIVSYNFKIDDRFVKIYKEFKSEKYINGVVAESKNYTVEKFNRIFKKEK
jgi:hypothetical protein